MLIEIIETGSNTHIKWNGLSIVCCIMIWLFYLFFFVHFFYNFVNLNQYYTMWLDWGGTEFFFLWFTLVSEKHYRVMVYTDDELCQTISSLFWLLYFEPINGRESAFLIIHLIVGNWWRRKRLNILYPDRVVGLWIKT